MGGALACIAWVGGLRASGSGMLLLLLLLLLKYYPEKFFFECLL